MDVKIGFCLGEPHGCGSRMSKNFLYLVINKTFFDIHIKMNILYNKMKYIKIAFLSMILLAAACSKYKKIQLAFRTAFSLPVNKGEESVKVLRSSGIFCEIPSAYQIKDDCLYIIDKYNNRMIQYNNKNSPVSMISNTKKNTVNLFFAGSNRILQPLYYSEKLFSFRELGNLQVNEKNIYLESILMRKDKEQPVSCYSFILKYTANGEPVDIIGNRQRRSNRIYPFLNMVKFSVDTNNDIFVYMLYDENWHVLKLNKGQRTVFRFFSKDFLLKNNIKPDKKKNEKIIIESIDNSADGNYLITAVTHFREEIKFQTTQFYRTEIKSGNTEKIFAINNENYNFILIDNSDRIYLWETEKAKKFTENIVLRLYSTSGDLIKNYSIKLNRKKTQWFDIKIHKDKKITGINMKDNKYNVVVWK
jgi:hypothetical protein